MASGRIIDVDGILAGKRVVLLGAETHLGELLARSLAEAGADVALIASSEDATRLFAVKRLSRYLASLGRRSPVQSIDLTNEMALRVMVRQISKELGGFEATIFAAELGAETAEAVRGALRFSGREMARKSKGGMFIEVGPERTVEATNPDTPVEALWVDRHERSDDEVVKDVVQALAGRGEAQ